MITRLFRPLPYGSVALFAVASAILGTAAVANLGEVPPPGRAVLAVLATVHFAAAAYLAACFARGLHMNLRLRREGVVTSAPITRIVEWKVEEEPAWLVFFTFDDRAGRVREDYFVEADRSQVRVLRAAKTASIRYHPDEPSIFRVGW